MRNSLWRLLLGRLLFGVPTLWVVITVAFLLVRLAPGGPFDAEQRLPPAVKANLDRTFGLDRPLVEQYQRYLGRVLHGDLGPSLRLRDRRVIDLVREGLPVSLTLGGLALVLALLVGISGGLLAAVRRGRAADRVLAGVSVLAAALKAAGRAVSDRYVKKLERRDGLVQVMSDLDLPILAGVGLLPVVTAIVDPVPGLAGSPGHAVNSPALYLYELEALIQTRRQTMPEGSYTTHLFKAGLGKIRKKTGEEAIELVLAQSPEETVAEASDLVYHLLVLLVALDIPLDRIFQELRRR